ncbi:hypothetical protein [Marinovum sp.]|uniref:hypothetical protein n=1 Tax=Marinovum sp. TaxID=2024839 RepID=UPI003A8DB158
MGLFGFGGRAASLPDFTALSVEQALDQLRALSLPRRNRAVASVLYSARARPAALEEQIALFDQIAALPDIAAHHRANARIARTHKALELGDADRLSDGMAPLLALRDEIASFSASDDIRQDRCHVGFSRLYVALNAALMTRDRALVADLVEEAQANCRDHLATSLPGGFYRSSANVMRCLAFALISGRHAADASRAEIAELAQKVYASALDKRPPAAHRRKDRKVSSGIAMPDAEFMRTAALAQLLTSWAEGADLAAPIGRLAVAQRTEAQRDRLLTCWTALT